MTETTIVFNIECVAVLKDTQVVNKEAVAKKLQESLNRCALVDHAEVKPESIKLFEMEVKRDV